MGLEPVTCTHCLGNECFSALLTTRKAAMRTLFKGGNRITSLPWERTKRQRVEELCLRPCQESPPSRWREPTSHLGHQCGIQTDSVWLLPCVPGLQSGTKVVCTILYLAWCLSHNCRVLRPITRTTDMIILWLPMRIEVG